MTRITEYLEILLEGSDLSFKQAKDLLDMIFAGEVSAVQIAAFLAAMRAKRAAVSELTGFATSMREHAIRVDTGLDDLIDTCGTGGAAVKTFNVSTASAIISAGAGLHIAKHGNRAFTSKCGSADVLSSLGVKIDCAVEKVIECIRQAGVGFMFAPLFHPAMKHVQPIRKDLDFRTAFNILGPLVNPARAKMQVMGVSNTDLMERIALALSQLDCDRAMVVHGSGLDELTISGPSRIVELKNGKISEYCFDPEDVGIKTTPIDELKGGTADDNAAIIRDILAGKDKGPRRELAAVNAAAAIYVADKADDISAAYRLACEAIDSGAAMAALENFVRISNS